MPEILGSRIQTLALSIFIIDLDIVEMSAMFRCIFSVAAPQGNAIAVPCTSEFEPRELKGVPELRICWSENLADDSKQPQCTISLTLFLLACCSRSQRWMNAESRS